MTCVLLMLIDCYLLFLINTIILNFYWFKQKINFTIGIIVTITVYKLGSHKIGLHIPENESEDELNSKSSTNEYDDESDDVMLNPVWCNQSAGLRRF